MRGLIVPSTSCVIMVSSGILYFLATWALDSSIQKRYRNTDQSFAGDRAYTLPPDEDVMREETLVRDALPDEYMVRTVNLSKQYNNGPTAVRGNTFGIKRNEVLGLLGPNGAGKSTTFSILTMEVPRSDGLAEVLGHDVTELDV